MLRSIVHYVCILLAIAGCASSPTTLDRDHGDTRYISPVWKIEPKSKVTYQYLPLKFMRKTIDEELVQQIAGDKNVLAYANCGGYSNPLDNFLLSPWHELDENSHSPFGCLYLATGTLENITSYVVRDIPCNGSESQACLGGYRIDTRVRSILNTSFALGTEFYFDSHYDQWAKVPIGDYSLDLDMSQPDVLEHRTTVRSRFLVGNGVLDRGITVFDADGVTIFDSGPLNLPIASSVWNLTVQQCNNIGFSLSAGGAMAGIATGAAVATYGTVVGGLGGALIGGAFGGPVGAFEGGLAGMTLVGAPAAIMGSVVTGGTTLVFAAYGHFFSNYCSNNWTSPTTPGSGPAGGPGTGGSSGSTSTSGCMKCTRTGERTFTTIHDDGKGTLTVTEHSETVCLNFVYLPNGNDSDGDTFCD